MEVVPIPAATMAESNQMSMALEKRLFDEKYSGKKETPCTLITGWLGSGKTTLVQHILRKKGDLRIAVLVNEFGEVDIDSLLVNAKRGAAALGLPGMRLAAGCACCSISADFKQAVKEVMQSDHEFDHLIIETSGVADPEPIAAMLEELAVRLAMIVTVVDVEALDVVLQHPVAKKQLSLADLVLINKCDLAGLGIISGVEDRVEEETGGTRAVRCRYCEVPLPLVLDITGSLPTATSFVSGSGSDGVLSHERLERDPVLSLAAGAPKPMLSHGLARARQDGPSPKRDHASQDKEAVICARGCCQGSCEHLATSSGEPAEVGHGELLRERTQHHAEAALESTVLEAHSPLSLAQLQEFVVGKMRTAPGLLRAKGVVWISEDRSSRYILQWSGRQRVHMACHGVWESTPCVSIVCIGRDSQALRALRQALLACAEPAPGLPGPPGLEEAADQTSAPRPSQALVSPLGSTCSSKNDKADSLRRLLTADPRFKVFGEGHSPVPSAERRVARSLVRFGLVGNPLRGIHEAAINSSLMRDANTATITTTTTNNNNNNNAAAATTARLFLSAASLPSEGNVLQLACDADMDVEAVWQELSTAATRVIARAHACLPGCRCEFPQS